MKVMYIERFDFMLPYGVEHHYDIMEWITRGKLRGYLFASEN